MLPFHSIWMPWLGLAVLLGLTAGPARADKFVYRDKDDKRLEVEARVIASGQGVGVLELADGQYRVVPSGAVEKRERAEGPEPMTPDQIAAALAKEFGAERFRSSIQAPFVMGLVLAAPLPRGTESRAANFLQQTPCS